MRILIATDGSEFSQNAVEKACQFIDPGSAEVKIISAYEEALPPAIEPALVTADYYQQLDGELAAIAEQNVAAAEAQIKQHFCDRPVNVSTEVLRGYADKVILEQAGEWKADLIVVGSHGRGFWGRLLGSVSTGVVHHAPCAVLVVRQPHT